MSEEKLQKKYMEYQMKEQQLKQMQQHIEAIDGKMEEASFLLNSLTDLKKEKPGSEVLVPLSNGIFMRGTMKNADSMLVNVGAGVVVEKTLTETKELINSQIAEINQFRNKAIREFEKNLKEYSEIEEELKKLVK